MRNTQIPTINTKEIKTAMSDLFSKVQVVQSTIPAYQNGFDEKNYYTRMANAVLDNKEIARDYYKLCKVLNLQENNGSYFDGIVINEMVALACNKYGFCFSVIGDISANVGRLLDHRKTQESR